MGVSLGMIMRCDRGGLGAQLRDLHGWLKPDKTLLVKLPEPRGANDSFNADLVWQGDRIPSGVLDEFTADLDVLLTVETLYADRQGWEHVTSNCDVVLVANPELFDHQGPRPTRLVVPTPWELNRMPEGTQVIPHPTHQRPHRIRSEVRTFLHHAAPAMLDRNGTKALIKALPLVGASCNLIVHAPAMAPPWDPTVPADGQEYFIHYGKVDVRWKTHSVMDRWDTYPDEADVMVLPRRYGGLCLPAQDAASCGIPLLMTYLTPQRWWPGVACNTHELASAQMKGGAFHVYDPDVEDLAQQMTAMVQGDFDIAGESRSAIEWARSISWECVGPAWEDVCSLTS